ncbi:S-adenosyl-L-methionine-dependent methyltransferase [Mycena vitilis]|nr:S-adenosyl-L-methionine-dependent methyltransferase [Mycena vitilis]
MKLHPYPEVPYMQAYDPVVLESERATHFLMQRLRPVASPTFHDYKNTPPASVLDLGCGSGLWLLDAARTWRSTQFVGLDLVDIAVSPLTDGSTQNVRLVRGDFLKYALPFPDRHFELVRMANLALCIPLPKWEYVLREVARVLAPGGRLELVDDQTLFADDEEGEPPTPVGQASLLASAPRPTSTTPTPTSVSPPTSDSAPPTPSPLPSPSLPEPTPPPTPAPVEETSTGPWSTQRAAARDMERVFLRMLITKYGLHTRVADVLVPMLARVFCAGRTSGRVEQPTNMYLKLAPVGVEEREGVVRQERTSSESERERESLDGKSVRSWMTTVEWEKEKEKEGSVRKGKTSKKEKEQRVSEPPVPLNLSAKAAERLGITTGASDDEGRAPRFTSGHVQHPGLILWPATFIPVPPHELEMHATKHVQTLLGCKPALAEFVSTFVDPETGGRLVSEGEFEDAVWDYECFRRPRFNWPELPETRLDGDDLFADLPTPASARSMQHSIPRTPTAVEPPVAKSTETHPFEQHELTHVRTFRVFGAVKGGVPPAPLGML